MRVVSMSVSCIELGLSFVAKDVADDEAEELIRVRALT